MRGAARAAACLFAAGLALSPLSAAGEEDRVRLTLLFTNDVHGYVEPCG